MVTARKKRTPSLTADERAAIRSLRPAFGALIRAFDADLTRGHGLSHTEFLALMFLSEADDRTLRISDLAAACQQSLSAISRTVGRLEKGGLVRRQQAPNDARSHHAVLTDDGLARLEEAWPTHLDSVRTYFIDNLEGIDVKALAEAFERMAARG